MTPPVSLPIRLRAEPDRAASKFGAPSDGGDHPTISVIYLIPIIVLSAVLVILFAPSILP